MHKAAWLRFVVSFSSLALLLPACTCSVPVAPMPTDGASPDRGECIPGELVCDGLAVARCLADGTRMIVETCAAPMVCAPSLGCRACAPGERRCENNDVEECRADGSGWDAAIMCAEDEVCRNSGRASACVNACDLAVSERSNIGCEYWAVDLDNEYAPAFGPFPANDAAGGQLAIAIANPNDVEAEVRVELNDAPLGSAPAPRQIFFGTCPPRGVLEIPLPQREVDGSTDGGHNDGPGTFVSSRAFHVLTNYPVVAYQFNPIEQQFSNDASLLIPQTGLDTHYRVLGWPTANPIAVSGLPGVPDHSFVTIVGTLPATEVVVRLGGPIVGGGGIPATAGGGEVRYTLGPYDVLNLESDMVPGDLTGTVVESTQPVVVFSGGERGIAPWGREDGAPEPPGGWPESICCTDHLEEQVFPTSSWGSDFVITRSPQRGDSWAEPDAYRVMADRETTTITTNLGGELASFTLAPGEWRQLWAQRSFVLRSDHPISIEQVLVSQGYMPGWKPGHGGDPSMILFPPYEQYRDRYVFLTPSTFTADYVVLAMPTGTTVLLDGEDVNGDEFRALCTYEDAGDIDGTVYQAVTCPVEDGPHEIESTMPVGLMVYGYYNVGSYGYAGGSDLERINLF
jgi:hypothetical protein